MADHSVTISLDNSKNNSDLILALANDVHGNWNPSPPPIITAGTTVSFAIIAGAGFYGAEGVVTYDTADSGQIMLTFGDPITGSNYATVTPTGTALKTTWQGQAGASGWQPVSVPSGGNPVALRIQVIGT
jgi:hypothetical protein